MPKIDIVVSTKPSTSSRARALEAMFDVPIEERQKLDWHISAPIDDDDWSIGAVVGPSGSGKTTISQHLWPDHINKKFDWHGDAVVDDFSSDLGIQEIAECCSAVGFNTIPAWLRPYSVLSNGEKFRALLARSLLCNDELIVMDEFTSVVDRQVAKIGSHAVQKYIRKSGKKFVAITCHDDVIDWLQPDWVIRPGEQKFERRSVQPRPRINITIEPTSRETWKIFRRFHYLTQHVHPAAFFSLLRVDGEPAAIVGWMNRTHNSVRTGLGRAQVALMRVVTLPDFQGLGLAFILSEFVSALFKRLGIVCHGYPAHAPFIRSMSRSKNWQMRSAPEMRSQPKGSACKCTGRPCAVFRYIGDGQTDENVYRHLSFFGLDRWWCRLPKWKAIVESVGRNPVV